LERNPNYRDEYFDAAPAVGDVQAQAIYQQLKGKKLPIIDRVELDVIVEQQPRWLAFLGREHDYLEVVPPAFVPYAMPNNKLAPHLEKRGITAERTKLLDVAYTFFNMEHPVIGGYTPDKVALRRAVAIGYDCAAEIRGPRKGQAVIADGPIAPGQYGYDAQFKSELSDYDPARAQALLDMYGYVDKDGDGWRDMPDGSALVLRYAGEASAAGREFAEVWKRSMDKLHIRFEFNGMPIAEFLKLGRQGKVMMGALRWTHPSPDGEGLLQLLYGLSKGERNYARFDLPRYNEVLAKVSSLPNGDERYTLMREAEKIAVAYMPTRFCAHRIGTDLMQPWLIGYKRHLFERDFWRYVDIDVSKLPK
jgi:ABC-type transport system substrate-binding protein